MGGVPSLGSADVRLSCVEFSLVNHESVLGIGSGLVVLGGECGDEGYESTEETTHIGKANLSALFACGCGKSLKFCKCHIRNF